MKYIVYVTSGSYSDFGVSGIMVGDVDPTPLLDGIADRMSDGLFKNFNNMESSAPYRTDKRKMEQHLAHSIREKAVETLEAAGFVDHKCVEVWLG